MTPRDKGRPRRVLVLALGLFCAAQLGFGLWLDHAAPLLRFTSLRNVLARLQKGGAQPDVLVLGSSRLEGAVVEAEARALTPLRVFNAAVPAGDPTAQEVVLAKLLTAGARPKRVLLEVSPEFFCRVDAFDSLNAFRLYSWRDVPSRFWQFATASQPMRIGRSRVMPLYEYREQVWAELRGRQAGPLDAVPLRLHPPVPAGRLTPDRLRPIVTPGGEATQAVLTEGGRWVGSNWLRNYRVERLKVDALTRAVGRCRGLGCEVWLVTPPLSSPHRANYSPPIEDAYRAVLAATGCRHVDCRDWMPDAFFVDSHHLSHDGGRAFTRRFVAEVLGR